MNPMGAPSLKYNAAKSMRCFHSVERFTRASGSLWLS
jgi:hypothetical protein